MGKVSIIIGDIVDDNILKCHDLIINPTNPQMVCGAGVSGSIFKKAGVDELEYYTQTEFGINYFTDRYNIDNIMKVGEVRITPGFNLGMDIMFVQGPRKWDSANSLEILLNTYKNMLNEAFKNGYKNVLTPSLGTGSYGFFHNEVGQKLIKIFNEFVKDKEINIDLVLYNEKDKQYYL